MTDQDRYIAGVPCWIDTSQPDAEVAVAFYGGLFGWEFEDVMPPGSPASYYIARLRDGDVAAVGPEPENGGAAVWNTYVWVTDADQTAAKVRAAGGAVLAAPRDVGDDGRMGVFADPAGAVFRVWQAGKHRGAAIVNEHGSLSFNVLTTPDLDGAQAFYGPVFGWEILDIGGARCGRSPATGTSSSSARRECARTWRRWARPSGSRTSWRVATRSPTGARAGRSASRSTTPTRSRPERPSSVAGFSLRRWMCRGPG